LLIYHVCKEKVGNKQFEGKPFVSDPANMK